MFAKREMFSPKNVKVDVFVLTPIHANNSALLGLIWHYLYVRT